VEPLRAYSKFLERLKVAPLVFPRSLVFGEGDEGGQGDILRSVVRLEFSGYKRSRGRDVPCVREVLACGHWHESSLGNYGWQRPRKTAGCWECWNLLFTRCPFCGGARWRSAPPRVPWIGRQCDCTEVAEQVLSRIKVVPPKTIP
jgi:hypothetical protein